MGRVKATDKDSDPQANAQWTTSRSLAMINSLQEQAHLGHQSDNGFKPIAWTAAEERMKLQFPPGLTIAQMKNHYTVITGHFRAGHKNARAYEKKSFPLYKALEALIGHIASTGARPKKALDNSDAKDNHGGRHGWNPNIAPEDCLPSDLQNRASYDQNNENTASQQSILTQRIFSTQPALTQPNLNPPASTQPAFTRPTSTSQINDSNKRNNPFTSANHQLIPPDTQRKKFNKPTPKQPTNLTSAITMMNATQLTS
ncbi:hypothetical protein DFH28DRAFT_934859 [Melampsora americana]|nr:hypothetical protein DFH28DRAFT_934859 [Melampsora americana]